MPKWRWRKRSACEEALQACDKTLQAFMAAARRLDPGVINPPFVVGHMRYQYYIRKGSGDNWSGDAVRSLGIRAADNTPVQFCLTQIEMSKHAIPIRYLDGLNFSVEDDRGRTIPYLPLDLDDRRKRLLLIFSPPINPGDSLRSVISKFSWDGMWNQLKLDRQEALVWPYFSKEPCELFEIEVFWDPELRSRIEFSLQADQAIDSEGPKAIIDGERHWQGSKYLIRNVKPGTTISATLSVGAPRHWSSSPGLLPVARRNNDLCWGDVIFVHGLSGDRVTTWLPTDRPDLFWPELLSVYEPRVNVWSIGYAAHGSGWNRGTRKTMSLDERATNILVLMEAAGIGHRPIIFVCHSYGGLVVKQMLRNAMDRSDDKWKLIAGNTKGVFFLSTPHSGADLATYLTNLGIVFQTTDIVRELGADNAYLTNLNRWYQENSRKKPLGVDTKVLYEKLKTGPVLVVNAASADPGMSSVTPIPVDEDHISICKPKSSGAVQFALSLQFIETVLALTPESAPE